MFIFGFLLEVLFFTSCGWVGRIFFKVITLGKVELDYGESSEGVITEFIGLAVLVALACSISFVINYYS